YYLDPKLVADYRAYYNPTPVKQVPKPIPHETRIDETPKGTQEKPVERSQPIVIRPQIYIAVIIGFALVVGSIYANNSHGLFPNPFIKDSRSETLPETENFTENETGKVEPGAETAPEQIPEDPPPLEPEPSSEQAPQQEETPEPPPLPEPDTIPDQTPEPSPTPPIPEPVPEPENVPTIQIDIIAKCTKIYDGDTFEISNGKVIRLADINTPEKDQAGYQESSDYLKSLIYDKTVYLELDELFGTTNEGTGTRLVCVVYLKSGLNVNQLLLDEGYAIVFDNPNEFNPQLWSLENGLDISLAGDIIEEPQPNPEPTPVPEPEPEPIPEPEPDPEEEWLNEGPFWGSKLSDKYHKPSCFSAKQIKPENLIIFSTREAALNKDYVACKVCKP
ncbi:hypothetical protein E4H04_08770, partial [Candidatus Bathyarchaeota archaeon]